MITDIRIVNRDYQWVDVQEPHEEDLSRLSSEYGIPYLLVQDLLRPEHLPKYEYAEEGHFLMLRSFDVGSDLEAITVQELTRKIALFITDQRLITIHRVDLPYLNKVAERCSRSDCPRNLQALIYQVILSTVRSYEEPLSKLQDQYDEFEAEILEKRCESISTTKMYVFRRKLFVLKRMLKETEEALYRSREYWEDQPSLVQDLKENCSQLYFRLDEISSNFEHLFQLYVSLNDQRANEVMKTLTVFSSVLLPLNFLASFYGMNFKDLPGLDSGHALYFLITAMLLISVLAVWYFRRKGWFRSSQE